MPRIYTIGHSTRSIEQFVALLKRHKITHLVDARTRPFSRHAPQFNRFGLEKALAVEGINYIYRGQSIGGLGVNKRQEEVLDGLARMAKSGVPVAIMCSEGDYHDCHRYTVLAPLLVARGVQVEHIVNATRTETHLSAEQEKLFGD